MNKEQSETMKRAIAKAGAKVEQYLGYFECRIGRLNCTACLHAGTPTGVRARCEIAGMLEVLNALGFEVVGNYDDFSAEFRLVAI